METVRGMRVDTTGADLFRGGLFFPAPNKIESGREAAAVGASNCAAGIE